MICFSNLDLGMLLRLWYTLLSSNCTSTSKALSSNFFSSFKSLEPFQKQRSQQYVTETTPICFGRPFLLTAIIIIMQHGYAMSLTIWIGYHKHESAIINHTPNITLTQKWLDHNLLIVAKKEKINAFTVNDWSQHFYFCIKHKLESNAK